MTPIDLVVRLNVQAQLTPENERELLSAALLREAAEEITRLRKAQEQLMRLAHDARNAWDTDQDSRTGKLLLAMVDEEFRKQYRPDL